MTCQEITAFLMDYVHGELDAPQRQCFDEHLGACPACIAYLATYRDTITASKTAFADPQPGMPEELVRAIAAACKQG